MLTQRLVALDACGRRIPARSSSNCGSHTDPLRTLAGKHKHRLARRSGTTHHRHSRPAHRRPTRPTPSNNRSRSAPTTTARCSNTDRVDTNDHPTSATPRSWVGAHMRQQPLRLTRQRLSRTSRQHPRNDLIAIIPFGRNTFQHRWWLFDNRRARWSRPSRTTTPPPAAGRPPPATVTAWC